MGIFLPLNGDSDGEEHEKSSGSWNYPGDDTVDKNIPASPL